MSLRAFIKSIGLRSSKPYEVSYGEAALVLDPQNDLERLFLEHNDRGTSKWLHYLPIYERYLNAFRSGFPLPGGGTRPLRFLEIGVSFGGSLQLWRKYFGESATIVGVDRDPNCRAVDDADLIVRIGSQGDPKFLRSLVEEIGGIDVVLDDGSHRARLQRISFMTLFPMLADGGIYLLEDLHTSYWWRRYGGGYRRRGTGIEMAKDLVDGIHGRYFRRRPPDHGVDAVNEVYSVAFYDSVVAIEKKRRGNPAYVNVGRMEFPSNSG